MNRVQLRLKTPKAKNAAFAEAETNGSPGRKVKYIRPAQSPIMKNTLAYVFAGMAVGVEAPFGVGNRVQIDENLEGQVVQVNWRYGPRRLGRSFAHVASTAFLGQAAAGNHDIAAYLPYLLFPWRLQLHQ